MCGTSQKSIYLGCFIFDMLVQGKFLLWDFAARKRNVFSSPVKQQTMHNIGVAWDCKMKRKLIVSVTAKKTTTSQHNGVLWNMFCTIAKERKEKQSNVYNCLVKLTWWLHLPRSLVFLHCEQDDWLSWLMRNKTNWFFEFMRYSLGYLWLILVWQLKLFC